jgi:hypothetical protein
MSAQPDFKAAGEFLIKFAELDTAIREFIQTGSVLAGNLESYQRCAAVRRPYGVSEGRFQEQAGQLYEALKQFPSQFSAVAAKAERVAELSRQLNVLTFDTFLKNE